MKPLTPYERQGVEMKVKTSELTGAALDWAVAKCEGLLDPVHGEPQPRVVFYSDQWDRYMRLNPPPQVYYNDRYEPSTSWAQAGPIIERERILIQPEIGKENAGNAWSAIGLAGYVSYGPTPLIAAMRCYCAKLGEFIDIPEELCQQESN